MTDDPTTLRRDVVVAVGVEKAFAVFTERFGEIKPVEQNLLAAPYAETVLEGRVGGAILDRGVDGSECRWAHVSVWEPPHRLVLRWEIGTDWQLIVDPATASEVEVTFTADGPDRTRVRLEHRHLDRHGPGWATFRDQVDGPDGWPLWLDRYGLLLGSV